MRIFTVCGSLQRQSSNRSLLERIETQLGATHEISRLKFVAALPHFNPDLEGDALPPVVDQFRKQLATADALIFASPEYGHSLPGSLKNAIDWVIRSGELYRKVVAITASVGHPERGRQGLQALRQTLLAVDAHITFDRPIVPEEEEEQIRALGLAVEEGTALSANSTL